MCWSSIMVCTWTGCRYCRDQAEDVWHRCRCGSVLPRSWEVYWLRWLAAHLLAESTPAEERRQGDVEISLMFCNFNRACYRIVSPYKDLFHAVWDLIVILWKFTVLHWYVLLYCIDVLLYCIGVTYWCIVLLYCIAVLHCCIVLLYSIDVLYYCIALICITVLHWCIVLLYCIDILHNCTALYLHIIYNIVSHKTQSFTRVDPLSLYETAQPYFTQTFHVLQSSPGTVLPFSWHIIFAPPGSQPE